MNSARIYYFPTNISNTLVVSAMKTIPTTSNSEGLEEIIRPVCSVVPPFPHMLCHSDFGHFVVKFSNYSNKASESYRSPIA